MQAAAAAENTNKAVVRPAPLGPAAQPPAPLPPGFKDQKEQMSYSIGMRIGRDVKGGLIDLDEDVLTQALRDAMDGKPMRMTDEQMQQGIRAWQMAARAKQDQERVATAEKNGKLGEAFLAENAKKEGVKTHTVTLPGGKTAEMQYKIITEGTGPIPKSNDVVEVTYRGTTIDGKEFEDSSKRTGKPMRMTVGRVPFRGWSEAWEMMKVGSKWQIFLPAALTRGDYPIARNVEAGSAVIYEMELNSIVPPAAPRGAGPAGVITTNTLNLAAPGPTTTMTSDIIKVPSAEQIKKGEKPKIMTPEEIQKEIQNAKKQ